ncbi:MAG: adenine deaminase [Methanobacteriaceae archaeon]
MSSNSIIKGNILDIVTGNIFPGEIHIDNGYIVDIVNFNTKIANKNNNAFNSISSSTSSNNNTNINNNSNFDFKGILIPGLIDAHIHIESSFLSPSQFALATVPHGTTAVVNDPHEIANVAGIEGINFMVESAKDAPMDFYFTAPSCVPATPFESSGATLDVSDIKNLLSRNDFCALGEVMNFPGVIKRDPNVMAKLNVARSFNKPIDGHAPGLFGNDLAKYVNTGEYGNYSTTISTDHECSSYNEAIEKKNLGMKILIREGSSAKNMGAILNISDTKNIMDFPFKDDFLVCDDIHPSDLLEGHVNELIKKAIYYGVSPIDAIAMVTINPAKHYNLDSGSIEIGKKANIILIDNLEDFNVLKVYYKGKLVARNGVSLYDSKDIDFNSHVFNSFLNVNNVSFTDFEVNINTNNNDINHNINSNNNSNNYNSNFNHNSNSNYNSNTHSNYNANLNKVNANIIKVIDGELITKKEIASLNIRNNNFGNIIVENDIENDILKIAVINRYGDKNGCSSNDKRFTGNIANSFVCGFGIKKGALASSFAHDSHNIIVIGCDSLSMEKAVNKLIKNKGGISVYCDGNFTDLELPIGGIMSNENVKSVSRKLDNIHNVLKDMGCVLSSPITTLSFISLLVIPEIKLSDRGLFDVDKFDFINIIR